MAFGSADVRRGTTLATRPAGASERGTSAASTPSTQRTQVCSPSWGTDSVDAGLFPVSVQPSGQQILSPPTRSMKATSVTPERNRTSVSIASGGTMPRWTHWVLDEEMELGAMACSAKTLGKTRLVSSRRGWESCRARRESRGGLKTARYAKPSLRGEVSGPSSKIAPILRGP